MNFSEDIHNISIHRHQAAVLEKILNPKSSFKGKNNFSNFWQRKTRKFSSIELQTVFINFSRKSNLINLTANFQRHFNTSDGCLKNTFRSVFCP